MIYLRRFAQCAPTASFLRSNHSTGISRSQSDHGDCGDSNASHRRLHLQDRSHQHVAREKGLPNMGLFGRPTPIIIRRGTE